MIDLLLKFPSRETAIEVGQSLGFTDENEETLMANHNIAVHVIGPHNGTDWWVMVRILIETEIPSIVNEYIVERDLNNPNQPNCVWY